MKDQVKSMAAGRNAYFGTALDMYHIELFSRLKCLSELGIKTDQSLLDPDDVDALMIISSTLEEVRQQRSKNT